MFASAVLALHLPSAGPREMAGLLTSMASLFLDLVQLDTAHVSLVADHSIRDCPFCRFGRVEPHAHRGRHAQCLLTLLEPCDVLDHKALDTPVVFFHDLVDDLLVLRHNAPGHHQWWSSTPTLSADGILSNPIETNRRLCPSQ